eukprot:scaffold117147_cov66-Attheya_sp.AAC.4
MRTCPYLGQGEKIPNNMRMRMVRTVGRDLLDPKELLRVRHRSQQTPPWIWYWSSESTKDTEYDIALTVDSAILSSVSSLEIKQNPDESVSYAQTNHD